MSAYLFPAGQEFPKIHTLLGPRRSSSNPPGIRADCALQASHEGSKRLIVPLRGTKSDFGTTEVAIQQSWKKPASGARPAASDL
jgi:hypothetical protein